MPIKAWPAARFVELIAWLRREKKLPVLLLGHVSEAGLLEEVAAGVAKAGAAKPPVWLGRDGEIPLLAALLAQCRFYLGHDTGAMHIAAALGRPVITEPCGAEPYLPVRSGMIFVRNLEEASEAVRRVRADWKSLSKAARHCAAECFDAVVNLQKILG